MTTDTKDPQVPSPTLPSLHHQTSQFRHWRFSSDQLQTLREELHRDAIAQTKANIKQEYMLRQARESNYPPDPAHKSTLPDESESIEFLTQDEASQLCCYYEARIRGFARVFKFSNEVQATAMVLFKRFYLSNSVLDYHPKHILVTCIFLSTKIENAFISLEEFTKHIPKVDPSIILELEFLVSQGVRFHYQCHHPYLPLHGLCLDAQSNDPLTLEKVMREATEWIHKAMLTDLCFLYQPSQIAVAAMILASKKVSNIDVMNYIRSRHVGDMADKLITLENVIQDICSILEKYQPVDKKVASAIDLKLSKCKNPAKDSESLLFQHIKEEERKAKELKHLLQHQKKVHDSPGESDDLDFSQPLEKNKKQKTNT